jgi:transaldolase/glucose-6-phosphate isomerase
VSTPPIRPCNDAGGHDYDQAIRKLSLDGKRIEEIYDVLTVEDILRAADVLRPTCERLEGAGGFASLEVPRARYDRPRPGQTYGLI